jgi:hypothetical protein
MFQPVAVPVVARAGDPSKPQSTPKPETIGLGDTSPASDEKSPGDTNSAIDVGPIPKQVIPEEELKQEPPSPTGEAPKPNEGDGKPKDTPEKEKKGLLDLW